MRILSGLLLTGVACAVTIHGQTGPPKQNSQPFLIEISTPSTVAKAGSEVPLKIRLTNTSDHEMIIGYKWNHGPLNPGYDYNCYDAGGKSVSKNYSMMGSLGDHPINSLKPDKTKEEVIPIDQACDLRQPGTYTIQLSRSDPSDPKHGTVKSNKITLIIIPND